MLTRAALLTIAAMTAHDVGAGELLGNSVWESMRASRQATQNATRADTDRAAELETERRRRAADERRRVDTLLNLIESEQGRRPPDRRTYQ